MHHENQADAVLMGLIRARDVEGFDALRLRYSSSLLRHLTSIVHNNETAKDLLQETFLRVWTRAEQWEQGAVKPWLFRIATNLALNSIRSVARRNETSLDGANAQADESCAPAWTVDSITPEPYAVFEKSERSATLRRLVDELPEEKRELIRLVYEAEMDVRGAAQAMGIPEGTAKSRLHYSTKYLARQWRDLENE